MKQVIVVFERPDLDAAAQLCAQLPSAEIWVFDPHLLDNLAERGIHHGRFIDTPTGIDISRQAHENRSWALAVEREIDQILLDFVPEAEGCYWQHLNWLYLGATISHYAKLWDNLTKTLPDAEFHIPVYDAPATYYTPSFLPAILLLERLAARGFRFSAYSHSRLDATTQFIPGFEPEIPENGFHTFTHIPTCIYDRDFLEQTLLCSGRAILNFPSFHWNVPIASIPSLPLCRVEDALRRLPEDCQRGIEQTVSAISSAAAAVFRQHLKTDDFCTRQASHLAFQYRAQLVFFEHLGRTFSGKPPQKIILSNHDSGLHGPFISFARKYRIPVIFVPHAKIFNFPIQTTYENVQALPHPIQRSEILALSGRRIPSQAILFPEEHRRTTYPPARLNTVGIILNKFSGDGICLLDTHDFIAGLKEIVCWCQAHQVNWEIRLKPGGTCIRWLASELELDPAILVANLAGTMADFGKRCDLCVMYDSPTSGAIDLLRLSIPTVNTVIRALCAEEAAITNHDIVPLESVPETQARLAGYLADPNRLEIFRNEQFSRYMAAFQKALPAALLI